MTNIRNKKIMAAFICGFALIFTHTNIAFAAFSSFEVITPDNEAEYPFLIQAQPLEKQPGYTRVRSVMAVIITPSISPAI